jgi:protocatechuate 3,4-dioxygenase beta subunit
MRRLTTTVFFVNEPVSPEDPVLAAVSSEARSRLLAQRAPELDRATDEAYRFDIIVQGDAATPFFRD